MTTLNYQTKRNRDVAETEAKAARVGRKAQFQVEAHVYTSQPFATLHISNEQSPQFEQNQSVYVMLDEDDLKQIQDAVFAARKKLRDHRIATASVMSNPEL
jgi:hypothetical protein